MDSRPQVQWVLPCLTLLAILSACSGCGDRDVQRRLDQSIRDLQRYGDRDVLATLRQATPETLQTPTIVWVRAYAPPVSSRWGLWVKWVEKRPTPNAMLVYNHKTGYRNEFVFDELFLNENKREAEVGFDYNAAWFWEPRSEEWNALERQLQDGEAEAVLLRDGKPVSHVSKVEFHRTQYKRGAASISDAPQGK